MEFKVKINYANNRDVIIGQGAGWYLEVIDPQKQRIHPSTDTPETSLVFQLYIGSVSDGSNRALYVVERAAEHKTKKFELKEYGDAFEFYCKERNLVFSGFTVWNQYTYYAMHPSVDFDEFEILRPLANQNAHP